MAKVTDMRHACLDCGHLRHRVGGCREFVGRRTIVQIPDASLVVAGTVISVPAVMMESWRCRCASNSLGDRR